MNTTTDINQVETLHALRVKGLASDEVLSALTGLDSSTLAEITAGLVDAGWAIRREGRMAGTMLTPAGKEHFEELLSRNALDDSEKTALDELYAGFLPINADFKRVCAAWQMRDDTTPNDHSDATYDAAVIADLERIHTRVVAIVDAASPMPRWSRYATRLTTALQKVKDGDSAAFARPMYDSYHDIWMELHQDLLITGRRERGTADEA